MPVTTYRDAIGQALDEEMTRDDRVLLLGEEVGQYNGAYKVSRGLLDKFGPQRVIDTPISEEGFTGVGIGAALAGLRPVVEWMTFNFAFQAFDQIINNAAKMRYMSGGQLAVPAVFRGPNGPAEALSSQHSQAAAAFYAHVPGLKVIAPATPADAKGLLKTGIRDDNPVICLEGELMYNLRGDIPDEEHLVPIGLADIKRPGADLSIITFGRPLHTALAAAAELEQTGIDAEVLDLRSLRPLDENALIQSVRKTHRCVVVDESWPVASVGAYVAHLLSNRCFDRLDAPVELVAGADVPMPYNRRLELTAQPTVEKIIDATRRVLYLQ